ncbi:hypothetical protein [Halovivax gelatinilyticus]|uniref:hypothetical protein n=1 Tax=Halovivax gelatinilyticus TaxID=2961597 RepID=UPI0020CA5618|nr:hypothetical protein [Halovivax gelatinilyticus]
MTDWIDAQPRYDEYWDWAAVALFLFVTLDLLTSLYATEAVGLEHELNPIMAWLLGESLYVIVTVHVFALVLAAAFFHALFTIVRDLPPAYRGPTALSVEIFLGLLVAAGFFVFANNLAVLIVGEGLV